MCYILEEPDADGKPRWRGICQLHPGRNTNIPLGVGRFSLRLFGRPPLELDARVSIEADSGSLRASFRDVAPPHGADAR